VKNSLTGFLCLGLFCFSAVSTVHAQDTSDAAPNQGAPPNQAAPPQQTPPQQTPQQPTPPQPTPPPQPAAAPPETETPAAPKIIRKLPPPAPKVADVRMPGEAGYYIGLIDWIPIGKPWLDKGHGATFTGFTKLQYAGTPKYAPGIEIGIAAGAHNALKISYFQSKADGLDIAPNDLVLYSQPYSKGDTVSTSYKIRTGKVSFEYLTWPFPVESRHFRLKTLWQVQLINMNSSFDAPLLPTTDSSGNPITYQAQGARTLISPTLGLGIAEYATRNFRFELNASGFDVPHHWAIWDTDASISYRIGHIEIRGGGKALHFKTSTKADYFQYGSLGGAYIGLRWYSD
jgi:hypothetical protein